MALDACSLLRVCAQNMNPNDPSFSSSVFIAQIMVALGVALGVAGVLALVIGMSSRRKDKSKEERKNETIPKTRE